eukprot:847102_1
MGGVDSDGKADDAGKCLLGIQAFIVAIFSGLASWAWTAQWFDSEWRGIFMICMASCAVIVRCLTGCYFASDSWTGGNLLVTRVVLVIATISDGAFDILQG